MTHTFDQSALAIVRRAYARQMLAVAGIASNPKLEDAFASVKREDFLGSTPWHFSYGMDYQTLPIDDPVLAYQDILFALSPSRGVNNGSPSLHAKWLSAVMPLTGKRIAHIGAGSGYYTAIMARLTGNHGRIFAVEYDAVLANMAKVNLAGCDNVTVVIGDGAAYPSEEADCIYVNFCVGRPADAWIENLATGGRLIFPLGVAGPQQAKVGGRHASRGAALLVERRTTGYSVQWLGPAYFVCAEGALASTIDDQDSLKNSFERGGVEFVKSLCWGDKVSPDRCWYSAPDWQLCYDEVQNR
jgi:protein-L-isoaspartate(D-aspartate) O-methyltransferase